MRIQGWLSSALWATSFTSCMGLVCLFHLLVGFRCFCLSHILLFSPSPCNNLCLTGNCLDWCGSFWLGPLITHILRLLTSCWEWWLGLFCCRCRCCLVWSTWSSHLLGLAAYKLVFLLHLIFQVLNPRSHLLCSCVLLIFEFLLRLAKLVHWHHLLAQSLLNRFIGLAYGFLSFIFFLVKLLLVIVFNLRDLTLLRLLSFLFRIKLSLQLCDLICEGLFNYIIFLLFELLNDIALNFLIQIFLQPSNIELERIINYLQCFTSMLELLCFPKIFHCLLNLCHLELYCFLAWVYLHL